VKLAAQLRKIDIDGTEHDQRFAFGLVLDTHDGQRTFVSSGQTEKIDNLALNRFVRHHFAADL